MVFGLKLAFLGELHGNSSEFEACPSYHCRVLPASGSLSVFAWMREPNVSETHFGGSFTATRKCEKKDGNVEGGGAAAKNDVLKWRVTAGDICGATIECTRVEELRYCTQYAIQQLPILQANNFLYTAELSIFAPYFFTNCKQNKINRRQGILPQLRNGPSILRRRYGRGFNDFKVGTMVGRPRNGSSKVRLHSHF